MWVLRALGKASVTFALTSSAFFATSAAGQSPVITPHSTGAASKPEPGSTEDRVAAHDSKPKDYQSEIDAVKAENLALRELLRKIRYESAGFRQRLVGTAGAVWETWQSTEYVR